MTREKLLTPRKRPLSLLVSQAFTGLAVTVLSSTVLAQSSTPERVTITGSSIKRTDAETVAPVDIITRETIERTGKSTVAEVIRNVSADLGSYNENFTNSFAPGSAGVSLRGLGQKNTLVLINGRRTAPYGLAQNISDTFVDLNSIPSSAVERVEILKDGASAVYGSDAIGGVVNIILRKQYQGAEVSGTFGTSRDGGLDEKKFSGAVGYGDLQQQGFNVLATFDYYKRDGILMSDRDFSKNSDRRDRGGIWQLSTNGGTWRGTGTPNRIAISGCPGKVLTLAQLASYGVSTAGLTAGGTFCAYDPAQFLTLIPSTERKGFLANGTFKITDDISAFANVSYNETSSLAYSTPAGVSTTAFRKSGNLFVPYNYAVRFPGKQGGNPFASTAEVRTLFWDVGPRTSNVDNTAYRVTAGVQGTTAGWDWETAVSTSKTKTINQRSNYISTSGLIAATTYNFDNPLSNPAAVTNSIRSSPTTTGESQLDSWDIKASRELFQLPGGAAALALGTEFRRETLHINPSAELAGGDVLGLGQSVVNGSRNAHAVYAELGLPITKTIEGQLAVRYDHYSDFGSSTVPKAGVKWKAMDGLLVRANWGKGFRAPTLPEISPSQSFAFVSAVDTAACRAGGSCAVSSTAVAFSSNPNLKPEKSENINIGFVLEPIRDLSVGLDYYRIKQTNVVSSDDTQTVIDRNDPTLVIRDPLSPITGTNPTVNQIAYVVTKYLNLDYIKTSGIDLDTRYKFQTPIGGFDLGGNVTWILKYDQPLEHGGPAYSFVGNNGPASGYTITPRYKAQFHVTHKLANYSLTANVRYLPSYDQSAGRAAGATVSTNGGNLTLGNLPDRVASQTTVDLYGTYAFTKDLTGVATVTNLFNKYPPFDPYRSSTFAYAYDAYDPRGRTFSLGLKFKFF